MNALTAGITPPRLTSQVQTQEQNHTTANAHSLMTGITVFSSPLQCTARSRGFPVSPGTPGPAVGRRQQTLWSQKSVFQHAAMLFPTRAKVACPTCVHLQHFVDSPLPVASWLSTAGITQGLHLRFILTRSSPPSLLGKRKGTACDTSVLSSWSSIAGCSHQLSKRLIVSTLGSTKPECLLREYQKVPGSSCCFLIAISCRSTKLSFHHFSKSYFSVCCS